MTIVDIFHGHEQNPITAPYYLVADAKKLQESASEMPRKLMEKHQKANIVPRLCKNANEDVVEGTPRTVGEEDSGYLAEGDQSYRTVSRVVVGAQSSPHKTLSILRPE